MHFHAGQPFQMYSSHENTPVCKFAENGPKVKPPTVKAPRYLESRLYQGSSSLLKAAAAVEMRPKVNKLYSANGN